MNERVLSNYDVFTVGEMVGERMPMEEALRYVGRDGDGLDTLFHFDHVTLDLGGPIWERSEWELGELREVFTRWQEGLYPDGWNSLYLSNHDQPRLVSRFGDDGEYRVESAKLFATLLFTLRGTPYIYQGAEIGMTNYPFESLEEFRDVETINPVQNAMDIGDIGAFDEVKEGLCANSRDNARTPMQWSAAEHAGFTDGEPWINVNPNHEEINVEAARDDPDSVWHYYRDLIDLRKEHDVLVYGEYDLLLPDHDSIWAYTRTLGNERVVVALNVSATPTTVDLEPEAAASVAADGSGSAADGGGSAADGGGAPTGEGAELLVANYEDVDGEATLDSLELRPYEVRVYRG
jgi:oligo-1,6-glucosidase